MKEWLEILGNEIDTSNQFYLPGNDGELLHAIWQNSLPYGVTLDKNIIHEIGVDINRILNE